MSKRSITDELPKEALADFYRILSSDRFWYLFKIYERVNQFAEDYSGYGYLTFRVEVREGKPVRMVCERVEESIMSDSTG
ncbi:MAG: hypothetical protein PHQ43_02750 [Dehalococcoidales bacterium]|nr:hypothetical protein [Dehalococcoidales bacterium]